MILYYNFFYVHYLYQIVRLMLIQMVTVLLHFKLNLTKSINVCYYNYYRHSHAIIYKKIS